MPLIVHSKGDDALQWRNFQVGTVAAGGGKVVMRVWLVNGHGDVKAITANTHSWPAMTTDAAV